MNRMRFFPAEKTFSFSHILCFSFFKVVSKNEEKWKQEEDEEEQEEGKLRRRLSIQRHRKLNKFEKMCRGLSK